MHTLLNAKVAQVRRSLFFYPKESILYATENCFIFSMLISPLPHRLQCWNQVCAVVTRFYAIEQVQHAFNALHRYAVLSILLCVTCLLFNIYMYVRSDCITCRKSGKCVQYYIAHRHIRATTSACNTNYGISLWLIVAHWTGLMTVFTLLLDFCIWHIVCVFIRKFERKKKSEQSKRATKWNEIL